MSSVEITRIDNFVCPACGEVMRQVAARDGIVKGWCPTAKKEIKVDIKEKVVVEAVSKPVAAPKEKPLSYLETLVIKREKCLRDVVSAREDGDLKENSAYHAAREQLSILDDKIRVEEERIKQDNRSK
jgi:hypothetical protein